MKGSIDISGGQDACSSSLAMTGMSSRRATVAVLPASVMLPTRNAVQSVSSI